MNPLFERVRVEADHGYTDFRHVATGRHLTVQTTFTGTTITAWREYAGEEGEGQGLGAIVGVDVPHSFDVVDLPGLMVRICEAGADLAAMELEQAAITLFPDSDITPAADPVRGDGMYRFHIADMAGMIRIRTEKGRIPPDEAERERRQHEQDAIYQAEEAKRNKLHDPVIKQVIPANPGWFAHIPSSWRYMGPYGTRQTSPAQTVAVAAWALVSRGEWDTPTLVGVIADGGHLITLAEPRSITGRTDDENYGWVSKITYAFAGWGREG